MCQFDTILLNRFFDSNRILVVAVSTGFPMLHTVLLSNEELLLLWREVSPSQLVLADPSENFFPAFKRERHGGERDFGMLLNDLITIVAINKGVTPNDQRRDQLALFQDIFFKLLNSSSVRRRDLGLELRRFSD